MSRCLRISFTLAASLFSVAAYGCSCAAPPPPCQAIGYSGLVFLGTVTEISKPTDAFKTARMDVDRAFKGNLAKTVELFDDGMCNGPNLQAGRQYLMYTTGFPGGGIPSRGCTRSRPIEDADEDLAFLKAYAAGEATPQIYGTVLFQPDEPPDEPKDPTASAAPTELKDVVVSVSGMGKELRATTSSTGAFLFSSLAPGEYAIRANLSGYLNWTPEDVQLEPGGCIQADMVMKVDRRVEGTVRDKEGAPLVGAQVEMRPTNDKLERWKYPILLDMTDENGHYSIEGIPPGDYFLGINITSTPTKEQPFASTYYPGTQDRQKATRISFFSGASVQELDLQTPRRLRLVTIRGRLHTADGKAPRREDYPQVRIKEPGLYGQIEKEPIEFDSEGRFQLELCEGVRYSAFAFAGPGRSQMYSAPIEFTATRDGSEFVFILDKSADEFVRLSTATRLPGPVSPAAIP
jgi:hypothetical protein